MALDDLVTVIETLQQRIREHGPSLRENETRTRMALIDPLLTALGWDVADPALVTPEYRVASGWADYALQGRDSVPAAIVEAKRLAHAISDDERMQMLNYANISGVRYAAVTDGNVWELYEVFKPGTLADRRMLNLHIAGNPPYSLAFQLLLLLHPNLASGRPRPANEPLFREETVVEQDAPSQASQDTPPAPNPSPPGEPGWVRLPEYDPPLNTYAPTAIRFPDGVERKMQYWYHILVEVAAWLNTTGKLTPSNVPVSSSPWSYIVHTDPVHTTGNEFRNRHYIADGKLVVNAEPSSPRARQWSRILLEHCEVDPSEVWLLPAD